MLLISTAQQSRVAAQQAGALAVLNNQTITLNDLDPRVRALADSLDGEIKAARTSMLNEAIDSVLFALEARKRGLTVNRLLALEVSRRVTDPSPSEVEAIYIANRTQFGVSDLNAARPQIVAYLRQESERKLIADFSARLRKRYPVVMRADINSPNLAPNTVLAVVGGQSLPASAFTERLKPVIYNLRYNVYQAIKSSVEQMIYSLLILDEARRRGVEPEYIIRTEVTEKLLPPTEEEVERFYESKKASINIDLASARQQIIDYLEQQRREGLERTLGEKLKANANVKILLEEPEPPALNVSTDDDPSRGAPNAPVTLVVFSDFQCPSCGANHPMIEEMVDSYGNQVRLVYRDFPLEMHENARKAAEAANAAYAQGKYFEYADVLFRNQRALDVASLKKYATEVGLNRKRFDAALDSGAYAAEVDHDIADGEMYGITGTPTVFVNGVRVNNLSAETLRAAIERELAKKKKR
ncbi:MAG: DsbA family protein [Acidobacteria bacterium]|nr:DsbA family protein [Acidobacteriota bacterium]